MSTDSRTHGAVHHDHIALRPQLADDRIVEYRTVAAQKQPIHAAAFAQRCVAFALAVQQITGKAVLQKLESSAAFEGEDCHV